jgi:transcriptional regulator with XRE-family HTH domain
MTENDRKSLIAARIRQARQSAGLSQGQVAKLLGVHRPSVSEIEAGNRKVSAEEIRKLASVFEVNPAFLLGESPETLRVDDSKIELAARELKKLSPDALDKLLHALAMFRDERSEDETGE